MKRKYMMINNRNAALLALAFATGSALAQTSGTWAGNSSGSWSDSTKWVGGNIADGAGATADLANVSLSSSNKTITMDSARTIGKLMLGASGRNLDIGIGTNILTLDDTFNALTNPGGDGIVEITYRVDSSRNGSVGVPIELRNNLLISNPNSGGNTGILISGGLSSSNGNLTITNSSNNNSRTKFNSVVSDGAMGNSITYIQTSGGWTEFNNANTFSGSTTNGAGTMILGNSLALQNSALDTTGSITGTASVGLRVFGAGVTSLTLGGLTGNKDFSSTGGVFNTSVGLYSQITALTLNPGTGKSYSYDGAIANGAVAGMTLTKTGAGTQILGGTSGYSGTTTVSNGSLLVNGSITGIGAVGVGGGATVATLGGSGSLAGAVTVNDKGILAPGASIESLKSGDLTFNTGSTFAYEMNSGVANSGDLMVVNGVLSVAGTVKLSLLDDSPAATAAPGTVLSLINYASGMSSAFFTYGESNTLLAENDTVTLDSNTWRINYGTSLAGMNFTGDYLLGGGNKFITLTLTAIPEPGSLLALGCLIGSGAFLRSRRRR